MPSQRRGMHKVNLIKDSYFDSGGCRRGLTEAQNFINQFICSFLTKLASDWFH